MRYYVTRPESVIDKFISDFSKPTNVGNDMDVYRQDDQYIVEIDMPGFNKEDISVDFKEDVLTVNAQHEANTEESSKEMIYQSRVKQSIEKKIRFSEVDVQEISAEYVNGTLKVILPCMVQPEPEVKKIELK